MLSTAYSKTAISSTLSIAEQHGIPNKHIILEITETEIIDNVKKFVDELNDYRGLGMGITIDDFGAGYAWLNLLADFVPDNIKIDMSLIRNIDRRGPRQAIVRGIIRTCLDLGIEILAEGIETTEEYWWCHEEGIEFFQGYLIAKPCLEHLPIAHFPRPKFIGK